MKLGTKIIAGFVGLIILAMLLGGIAVYKMFQVKGKATILSEEYIPEVKDMTTVTQDAYEMRLKVLGIALSNNPDYVTQAEEKYKTLSASLGEFAKLVKDAEHLTTGKANSELLTKLNGDYWVSAKKLSDAKSTMLANITDQGKVGGDLKKVSTDLADLLKKDLDSVTAANVASVPALADKVELSEKIIQIGLQLRLDGAAALRDNNISRLTKSLAENRETYKRVSAQLRGLCSDNKAAIELLNEQKDLFEAYFSLLDNNLIQIADIAKVLTDTAKIGNDLVELTIKTSVVASNGTSTKAQETNDELSQASLILGIGLIVAFVLGLGAAIIITRGITGPINRIITNLNEAGEQVAAASGQISSASQSLAEGATEQAASLEESSSALEEMASMTRQNADNAVTANQNMTQTQSQVSVGAEAVRNMSKAMDEINDSSEKISRIIKTIEEIAFQTNLLALNAAVEAARAGDAGKGFAVVADEVRNLAQRSAQAARDTADLIESTVARVKNGTEIVQQLQKSFVDGENAANSVAGLINEISAASNEQAQGVDQVNTAVAQMDKVTQTNAANAEESASAAEELNAQAEQLRGLVNELVKIVRGNDSATMEVHLRPHLTHGKPAALHAPAAHKNLITSHVSHGQPASAMRKKLPATAEAGKGGANVVKPNQVIPLDDDDDFNDF